MQGSLDYYDYFFSFTVKEKSVTNGIADMTPTTNINLIDAPYVHGNLKSSTYH